MNVVKNVQFGPVIGEIPEGLPIEEQEVLSRLHKAQSLGMKRAVGVERNKLHRVRREHKALDE